MHPSYSSYVILSFPESARPRGGQRISPTQWREIYLQAQRPAHQKFMNRYSWSSVQLDNNQVMIKFNHCFCKHEVEEFLDLFDGYRGRVYESDIDMLCC